MKFRRVNLKAPKFHEWTYKDYLASGLMFIVPMTVGGELKDNVHKREIFNSREFYCEEKLKGIRCLLHVTKKGFRLFTPQISKKTDWFIEESDYFPQIRDLISYFMVGTILDGVICDDRFHVFDILFFGYRDVRNEPFFERRRQMAKAVNELEIENSSEKLFAAISIVNSFPCDMYTFVNMGKERRIQALSKEQVYPVLAGEAKKANYGTNVALSAVGYYEWILMNGGEGVILKDRMARYKDGEQTDSYFCVTK